MASAAAAPGAACNTRALCATTTTAHAAGRAGRAWAEEDLPSRVHALPVVLAHESSSPTPPLSARGRLQSSGAGQTTVSPVAAFLRPTAVRATRGAQPPTRRSLAHAADVGAPAPKNAPPVGPNVQRSGASGGVSVSAAVGPLPAPDEDSMEAHALPGAVRLVSQTLQSKMLAAHGMGAQRRRSVPPSLSSKGSQGSRPARFAAAQRLPGFWAAVLALCVLATALGVWRLVQDARTSARGHISSTQGYAGWRLGTARGFLNFRRCDGHRPAVAGFERMRSPIRGSGASLAALLSSPAPATRDSPLRAMHRLLQKVSAASHAPPVAKGHLANTWVRFCGIVSDTAPRANLGTLPVRRRELGCRPGRRSGSRRDWCIWRAQSSTSGSVWSRSACTVASTGRWRWPSRGPASRFGAPLRGRPQGLKGDPLR